VSIIPDFTLCNFKEENGGKAIIMEDHLNVYSVFFFLCYRQEEMYGSLISHYEEKHQELRVENSDLRDCLLDMKRELDTLLEHSAVTVETRVRSSLGGGESSDEDVSTSSSVSNTDLHDGELGSHCGRYNSILSSPWRQGSEGHWAVGKVAMRMCLLALLYSIKVCITMSCVFLIVDGNKCTII